MAKILDFGPTFRCRASHFQELFTATVVFIIILTVIIKKGNPRPLANIRENALVLAIITLTLEVYSSAWKPDQSQDSN